ncbi:serine/threonine protein phosphatase [Aerococcaceae bacterium NML210727]|nr:serine/threonine protein phosphatase [Aerococcaceae bacterium NML210727]MCW6655128.1 serine/threonine protein phosphatase [Aerococcaceae bacterium NML201296]MCW6666901.1 serine/threonine protein phosphatase [Aerococcaceae bacterium NML190938]
MKQAFVVGDVHGMFEMLEELLTHWQRATQQLIFVGDLIDRGPNSLAVLECVRHLQAEHGAICLRGNHEAMLWETLIDPETYYGRYERNGGTTTITELLGHSIEGMSATAIADELNATQPWLRPWIEQLPLYTEFGNFVISHAGVDLGLDDWRRSTQRDFIWIREPFHQAPNRTGREFIFGHTPVMALHGDPSQKSIWHSDGKHGIDGGAVYGGVLHAVVIDAAHILESYTVGS